MMAGGNAGKAGGLVLPYRNHVPQIAADVYLAPGCVVIGNTVIGAGSSIWFNAVVRGDVNEIRIGERVNLRPPLNTQRTYSMNRQSNDLPVTWSEYWNASLTGRRAIWLRVAITWECTTAK